MSITVHRVPEVCDFCSDPKVVAAFPCEDFALPEYGWGSVGAFAACRTCADLIAKEERDKLAARSIATFKIKCGSFLPVDIVRGFVLRLHGEFWKRQRLAA